MIIFFHLMIIDNRENRRNFAEAIQRYCNTHKKIRMKILQYIFSRLSICLYFWTNSSFCRM